jgi:squalene-hopene/tetraprenyl-beta-curcumene cyclase
VTDDGIGRAAAQRGLAFLAQDTVAWQQGHNCYGCHVQAVTLDAMIVGRRNSFDVDEEAFREVLRGMLDIPGGARGPVGFSVQDNPTHLIETSRSFGGAALAEYDEHVGPELQEELVQTAELLLEYQDEDGSVRSTDRRPPVVAGLMQSTTQAARTWRQAHARTADDRWLLPIANAEAFIRTRASQLTDEGQTYLQDLSYAIIGLLAAGATPSEDVVSLLANALRERQNDDGGWGFTPDEPSDAFATGQALYVLKRLGTTDSDEVVSRATGWLVEVQQPDGSWSTGGDRRGEAMWAVMGLVSIDVLTIGVDGVSDGTHTTAALPIRVHAVDARGEPAASIELRVDDVPVHRTCGGELRFELDAPALGTGAHQIDVVATDARGKASRRRISIYTGEHYLIRVGSRFVDGATRFSLRNVAPAAVEGRVRLSVFRSEERDGRHVRGQRVHRRATPAAEGAMSFSWDGGAGASSDAETAQRGRYIAELAYVDARGRVRQTVEVPFVHDTEEAQHAQFGHVAGRIEFDEADVSGAEVELLDERGNVVQRATTTRSGQYRFRNVDGGRYRVRVNRRGFRSAETEVDAAPATAAEAPAMNLMLH